MGIRSDVSMENAWPNKAEVQDDVWREEEEDLLIDSAVIHKVESTTKPFNPV